MCYFGANSTAPGTQARPHVSGAERGSSTNESHDMTHHAIRIHEHGGPEQMRWEEVDTPEPGKGEVLVRHEAIGLNYIDVYHRTGLYPVDDLPFTPGLEAAGVVEAVGPGVRFFEEGDRVACSLPPLGAYAEKRVVHEDLLIPLPEEISCEVAAACLLQGMTAHYLLHDTYPVEKDDVFLLHAAAGGVGLIMCQWARAIGAHVIGTAGTMEKAKLAHENGAAIATVYTEQSFVDVVMEATEGQGVPLVYDSVGQSTFMDSLSCLSTRGLMVSFGQASGPIEPFDPGLLSQMGSLYLTRPVLMDYVATRGELLRRADALFDMITDGHIKIDIGQRFDLRDAAKAHTALESRETTGSTLLIP